MSGILKDVIYLEDFVIDDMVHPIKMIFIKDDNDTEKYPYQTTIEKQCRTSDEPIVGMLDEIALMRLSSLKSFIGKEFNINLYKFSVQELTNGKYVSLDYDGYDDDYGYYENEDCDEDDIIKEIRRATYKSREDIIEILKLQICLGGLDKIYVGIKSDGSSEDLDEKILLPIKKEETKHYEIPYEGFPEVDDNFILNKVPIENLKIGQYLASSIKYNSIRHFDGDYLIKRFIEYRKYVNEINNINNSLRKKLSIWETTDSPEPFDPTKGTIIECDRNTVLNFFKDCYILSKCYPKDCIKAKNEYFEKCENDLREKFYFENINEKKIKEKLKMTIKEQSIKYKGKEKIKMLG